MLSNDIITGYYIYYNQIFDKILFEDTNLPAIILDHQQSFPSIQMMLDYYEFRYKYLKFRLNTNSMLFLQCNFQNCIELLNYKLYFYNYCLGNLAQQENQNTLYCSSQILKSSLLLQIFTIQLNCEWKAQEAYSYPYQNQLDLLTKQKKRKKEKSLNCKSYSEIYLQIQNIHLQAQG
ncbi:hypothetical protein pb186bvf_016510 [Paramecium bursaria]